DIRYIHLTDTATTIFYSISLHDALPIYLHAGAYTVIVTDAKGCTATKSFEILNQNQLTVTLQSTLPACGQKNGSITVTVSGGTEDRNSTRLNSSHVKISYAVFRLKKTSK